MKGEPDETGTDAGSPFLQPDRTGPEHLIAENAENGRRERGDDRRPRAEQRGTGLCPLASGNRVGLRLRVEIVNLLAIAVFDDSAAQLQGGGEGSVVG